MSTYTIYHNPRCSKSRQTLALLEEHGVTPTIIKYLDETLDTKTLTSIIKKLGINPRELLRNKEADYASLNLKDETLSDEQLIQAMVSHPKLIERPIVVSGNQAVLGRPPENVLSLIG